MFLQEMYIGQFNILPLPKFQFFLFFRQSHLEAGAVNDKEIVTNRPI